MAILMPWTLSSFIFMFNPWQCNIPGGGTRRVITWGLTQTYSTLSLTLNKFIKANFPSYKFTMFGYHWSRKWKILGLNSAQAQVFIHFSHDLLQIILWHKLTSLQVFDRDEYIIDGVEGGRPRKIKQYQNEWDIINLNKSPAGWGGKDTQTRSQSLSP